MIQLTKNFNDEEFKCKCGCGEIKYNLKHITRLQVLRDYLRKPIIINSAYRCENHNKAIGGAPESRHVQGDATDIRIEGLEPEILADICENIFDGIGRYDTFTHCDSRGKKARWDMRGGKIGKE